MTLGKKIYTLRSAAQISQEALAERLDVSRQSVSKWEIDQAVPQIDKVLLLSELFSVSCDSLLRDDIDIYGDKPGERSSINEPSGGNKYFGTDGFRGEANITLTSEQAYKCRSISRLVLLVASQRFSRAGIPTAHSHREGHSTLELYV